MQQDFSTLPGRGPLVVACAECSKPLRVFPSFLKSRPSPTCSMACRSARKTRVSLEKNSRPCVVCGIVFYCPPSAYEKENRRTCGLKCRAVWQTGRKLADPDGNAIRFARYRVVQDGCYGWTGPLSEGYGILRAGERIRAHRFAWERATGETLTPDDVIGHTCDNRPCTRTDDAGTYEVDGVLYPRRGHLFKGTTEANVEDMRQKGRGRYVGAPGTKNAHAKLTEDDVRAIRVAVAGGESYRSVAARYGVTPSMIGQICRRASWAHVE